MAFDVEKKEWPRHKSAQANVNFEIKYIKNEKHPFNRFPVLPFGFPSSSTAPVGSEKWRINEWRNQVLE
jgi:hypothetical protein